jgi:hypothetical protein
METSCDNKKNSTRSGKLNPFSFPTKSHSSKKLNFGSWGLKVENKGEEPHCDFLLHLSRIQNTNPLPLIPIINISEMLIEEKSLSESSSKQRLESNIMEAHSDLDSMEM